MSYGQNILDAVKHDPVGGSPLPGVGAAARLSDAAGLAEVR